MPSETFDSNTAAIRVDRISMKDDGYYAAVSAGPRAVVDGLADRAVAALLETERVGGNRPIVIADFGAADGLIATNLISQLVETVRSQAPYQPIRICATDLPDTDFRPFFREMSQASSYVSKSAGVFVTTCGLSFFAPLFPPRELDLGFSSSAMHYLSRQPGPLGGRLHSVNADKHEATAFADQAAIDWNAILSARAAELAPNGRCIIAMLGIDEEGKHLGNTVGSNLFSNYETIWSSLCDDGTISSEEYFRAAFQQHYRTRDEIEEPFRPGGIADQQDLKLLRLNSQRVACPFHTEWLRSRDTKSFAENFVNTHRSWTETVFANALNPNRDTTERQEIIDELYLRYERFVKRNPMAHRKDLVHWIIEFKKMNC